MNKSPPTLEHVPEDSSEGAESTGTFQPSAAQGEVASRAKLVDVLRTWRDGMARVPTRRDFVPRG